MRRRFSELRSAWQLWRALGNGGRLKLHILWRTMAPRHRRRFAGGFRRAMNALHWNASVRGAPCDRHVRLGWGKRRIQFAGERFVLRYLGGEGGPVLVVVDHVPTWRRKSGTAPWHLAHQMAGSLVEDLIADLDAVRRGELPADAGLFAPAEERKT